MGTSFKADSVHYMRQSTACNPPDFMNWRLVINSQAIGSAGGSGSGGRAGGDGATPPTSPDGWMYGAKFEDEKILRFSDLVLAVTTFFEGNQKKFVLQLRR